MKQDLKYLSLLSKDYPTIEKANEEIIKLSAILQLPKGTEHFISDIHGEYDSLNNILRNASGVIKMKIDMLFKKTMSEKERNFLAALIYYPEKRLSYLKEQNKLTLNKNIDTNNINLQVREDPNKGLFIEKSDLKGGF